jgi:hypothetical protein
MQDTTCETRDWQPVIGIEQSAPARAARPSNSMNGLFGDERGPLLDVCLSETLKVHAISSIHIGLIGRYI